jgi:hypothetical protein
MSGSLPELLAAVRAFVTVMFPGRTPKRLLIVTAEDDRPIALPVPPSVPTPPPSRAEEDDEGRPAFVPTDLQADVLAALEGKALHADDLAGAVRCDRRRLYRHPGGLRELRQQGLVDLHPRAGYYRPDAPPARLNGGDEPAA